MSGHARVGQRYPPCVYNGPSYSFCIYSAGSVLLFIQSQYFISGNITATELPWIHFTES